ncbi:ABC transporter permease [Paracidobacterium acidisoli]|uniref:ABC transporter permease n=1 Tax=Paracidobacterium acidisoli TaxID=2303751 RepID=A0A372IPP8_9BACT|nr:ABC transporter permease [Paracidobacterium acidisoli]MBT9331266.1 ABC transporter permease [Paracidobacterium acidisoli]
MSRLSHFFPRRRMYDDLSEEIRQHLEEKVESLIVDGLSREDAGHQARREFGNAALMEERSREVWLRPWIESLRADVRFALRQIGKSPGFALTAILTLALGIGANTGIFTLVHALLLEDLPVPEPGRLTQVDLHINSPNGDAWDAPMNFTFLESIRRHATSFSGIFGWSAQDFALEESTGSHLFAGAFVTGNAFETLGLHPAAGRMLAPADDQPGGGPDGWAAVISYRFWKQHDNADLSVIGSHVNLAGHSVTIVGVAPEGFEGVIDGARPDFYLPLSFEPAARGAESRLHLPGGLWLMLWGRRKPGVSLAAASAEMHTIFHAVVDETLPPQVRHSPVVEHATFVARPGGTGWNDMRVTYTRPLLLLQILVGVVLLVCCINLAGLSLARTASRQHEFATRGALGAGRLRLMQQLLVESLLLALCGGAFAILLAWLIDRGLLQFLPDSQGAQTLSVHPELSILLFTGACAVVCALLCGIAPAWAAGRVSIESVLRRSGQNTTGRIGFTGRSFVPLQAALTLALVVIAAMLATTVTRLRASHPGFHIENALLAGAHFDQLPQKDADLAALYRRMTARLEQMPGMEDASVVDRPPLIGFAHMGAFDAADAPPERYHTYKYQINDVGAHFFAAFGTHILAGRDFANDGNDQKDCILNRSAAAAIFGGRPVLGQTVREFNGSMDTGKTATRDCQVIGIVEDAKYVNLRDTPPPTVYYPITAATENLDSLTFVLHAGTLSEGRNAWHRVLHEIAPSTPEAEPIAVSVQLDNSIVRERLLSMLSAFFAALTLLLSGIGIYGLMASSVARRTTEIGVRMALGSTRAGIFILMLRRVTALLLPGILLGGCLAWFAARSIRSFLFDVNPGSPALFAAAIVLLALCGFSAAMLPARRAASVDPMQALRAE